MKSGKMKTICRCVWENGEDDSGERLFFFGTHFGVFALAVNDPSTGEIIR